MSPFKQPFSRLHTDLADLTSSRGQHAFGVVPAVNEYLGPLGDPTANVGPVINGQMYLAPIYVPTRLRFYKVAAYVQTGGTAGALVRLGAYSSGPDMRPLTLLADAGTVDATTNGNKEAFLPATLELAEGIYWAAVVCQGAPVTPPVLKGNNGLVPVWGYQPAMPPSLSQGFLKTGVTGALPATLTGLFQASPCAAAFLRRTA